MNSKALVSVVTPFLNAKKFIQEAIESVLAQSYDNWELLLVDDGSTDGSTAIALRYTEQYPGKVRYLEHDGHQNRGKSTSRNLAINNAKGEYIAFLDADDVWLPQKLERQVAILDSQPEAAMVYGPTQYWYGWTGKPQDIEQDFIGELGVKLNTLFQPPTLLTLFLRNSDTLPCTCGLLVRRQVVEETGGFEETIQDMYEDQVFLAKICLQAPVFVDSGCWDRYRQHEDSSSYVAMKTGEYHPSKLNSARLTFLNWLAEYMSEQGVKETKLWNAFQKAVWPYHHPLLYRPLSRIQYLVWLIKKGKFKLIAQRTLPAPIYRWLRVQKQGPVSFGSLRRLTPISRSFGYDRGLPVDRYYIENFLLCHADDIRGRVLEIGDDSYTRKFGGDRVTNRDVLHVVEGNPKATIVADLTCADHIPSDTFDCFILTQTLHLVYDVRSALLTLHRILKPGGVVLVTFPGISQISNDIWSDYWYWSFTTLSARRLFEEVFPKTNVKVEAHGNVLAAISFLHGLAAEELRRKELEHRDRDYEVIITVRAVKPEVTL